MSVIKLVNSSLTTYNNTKWEIGKWNKVDKFNNDLNNGAGGFHSYDTLPIAALHNYLLCGKKYRINNPRPFSALIGGDAVGNKYMFKTSSLCIETELIFPSINNINMVAYGILCAKSVFNNVEFIKWAHNWLNGNDRSIAAADLMVKQIKEDDNRNIYLPARAALEAVINYTDALDSSDGFQTSCVQNASAAFYNAAQNGQLDLKELSKQALDIK